MSYKDALGKHAILKRVTGLKSIQFKSRPAKYSTTAEAHSRKDHQVDGQFESDFSENVIPGAVTGLAPFWNDIKDTYWVEDRRILNEIVESIAPRLRYPDNHPDMPGKIIKPEDVDPTNFWDYFFQHEHLQRKRMEGGKYVFQLQTDPIDAFLFYIYRNDPAVLVRDGREISKFVVGKAKFELLLPQHETLDSKAEIDKLADSMSFIKIMAYERKKHIARLMKLNVDDYDGPDPDALHVAIGKAASDPKKMDEFLRYAKMSNEDMMLMVDIKKAKDARIITSIRNTYMLNSEKMENVNDDAELFHYFTDAKNSEKYKDLVFLLQEKEKAVQ